MSYLPSDDKARKALPIWQMITGYFPKSFREITRVCVANNVRYNPDKDPADISWARGKSKDQLGSSFRHMMEAVVDGKVFEDDVSPVDGKPLYILAENAWRALAALEIAIETQEGKVPFKQLLVPTPLLDGIKKAVVPTGTSGLLDRPHPPEYSLGKDRELPLRDCYCPSCVDLRKPGL